jgi:hypothetical protein
MTVADSGPSIVVSASHWLSDTCEQERSPPHPVQAAHPDRLVVGVDNRDLGRAAPRSLLDEQSIRATLPTWQHSEAPRSTSGSRPGPDRREPATALAGGRRTAWEEAVERFFSEAAITPGTRLAYRGSHKALHPPRAKPLVGRNRSRNAGRIHLKEKAGRHNGCYDSWRLGISKLAVRGGGAVGMARHKSGHGSQ